MAAVKEQDSSTTHGDTDMSLDAKHGKGTVHDPFIPFSIQQLEDRLWVVRENDRYHEYPNIFVKLCTAGTGAVLVMSDTGCGTNVPNRAYTDDYSNGPYSWNIRTFLEYTLNPIGRIPYLVLSTHCHYDHILGIRYLPPVRRTIVASDHNTSFLVPYSNLSRNSLCQKLGISAPHYQITWAIHGEHVIHKDWNGAQIPTNITVLHTPGHTPDSLSWYDADTRVLCVGDSFYECHSSTTKAAPWGPEPPMPIMFSDTGNLYDWWESLKMLLLYVCEENKDIADEDYGYIPDPNQNPNTNNAEERAPHSHPPESAEVSAGSSLLRQQPQPNELRHSPQPDHELTPTKKSFSFHLPSFSLRTKTQSAQVDPTQLYAFTQTSIPSPLEDEYILISPTKPPSSQRPSKPRVRLAAAHVTSPTSGANDAHTTLLQVQQFMKWVLQDRIPKGLVESRPESEGSDIYLWDDSSSGDVEREKFSLQAPIQLVEEGRRTILRREWNAGEGA